MKVLIVCSGNFEIIPPFILDQVNHLKEFGVEFDYFLIKGKGFLGYLKNYLPLQKKIRSKDYSLVHAHHVLPGLLAVLVGRLPVIVSFHGGDIEIFRNRLISHFVNRLSDGNIFVNKKQLTKLNIIENFSNKFIPCGVDFKLFRLMNKSEARDRLQLDRRKNYVLFGSRFDRPEKNAKLAFQAMSMIKSDAKLIELKNYSRLEVSYLMNAVDILLLTSFREASPQVIKEAMACNLPIISTDVGDVRDLLGNSKNCFIDNSAQEMAEHIDTIINSGPRTLTRDRIKHLDNDIIASYIYEFYTNIINYNQSLREINNMRHFFYFIYKYISKNNFLAKKIINISLFFRRYLRKFNLNQTYREAALIKKYLYLYSNKNLTIIDVGASTGSFFEHFLTDNNLIFAFEPDPNPIKQTAMKYFEKNYNVKHIAKACSNESGIELPFYTSPKSTGISSLHSFDETHSTHTKVITITLSDYIKENKIDSVDILKIDTEGHDYFVLQGFPWSHIKPTVIMCEFEDKKTVPLGYTFFDLGNYLLAKGYIVFVSEWHPVVEYGGKHHWNKMKLFPCELDDPNACGNFICFNKDTYKKEFDNIMLNSIIK